MELVTRTFDLLERYQYFFKKDNALAAKENGVWKTYSTEEYIQHANHFSLGLISLGLKKDDKIAIISNNRPEWNFADMGMSQAGIISVPVYPTISTTDYEYILNHSKPKIILISDKSLYQKLCPVIRKIKTIQKTYTFDKETGAEHWSAIIETGKQNAASYQCDLTDMKHSILPEDIFTLIYTSGTTGPPKGVMLTHENIVSNFISTSHAHPYGKQDRTLSFLPLSHIYERMMNYHLQYKGISIYYAENMATIAENLKEVQPKLIITVPRLLEKMYDKIIGKGKELPYIKRAIFFWAVNTGLQFSLENKSWFYKQKLKIANALIFKKWKEALGNVEVIVSGGASLQSRLEKIFWAAGFKILQGYGLTETSPVIAVNNLTTNEIKLGTVGPVMENVEVKLSDDGEILCKGPNVMKGYYKEKKLTAKSVDKDGWLHTGDIGSFVDDKYLKISDRKKEIFKLSSGKYIAPQIIENKFKESIFIEQMMVVGENQKFAASLISPNFYHLHNWAYNNKIEFRDNAELINNPEVLNLYRKEVSAFNKALGKTEKIFKFRLVHEEWGPDTGELSPTLKIKRNVLYERYRKIINEIFGSEDEQTQSMFNTFKKGIRTSIKTSLETGKKITGTFKK